MTAWIEVNRAHLRHNFRSIQKFVGDSVGVIAVVKANAYGCGAIECSRIFSEAGAAMLAVTRLEEAMELREAGLSAPILVLAPLAPGDEAALFEHDLVGTIGSLDDARRIIATAEKMGKSTKVHLKIECGMNRFGISAGEATQAASLLSHAPSIEWQGVYTHFANAQTDATQTQKDFGVFRSALGSLPTHLTAHASNSAAIFTLSDKLNAVRPGTVLYGQFPSPAIGKIAKEAGIELRDPFTAKAHVVALRNLKKGAPVGYGSEWTAPKHSKIAVLAMGWADGLTLEPRARPESPLDAVKAGLQRAARLKANPNSGRMVEIRGQKLPLVARIAMQTCFVDVSSLPDIQIGDVATVPMRRVTAGAHLPRVYIGS